MFDIETALQSVRPLTRARKHTPDVPMTIELVVRQGRHVLRMAGAIQSVEFAAEPIPVPGDGVSLRFRSSNEQNIHLYGYRKGDGK